MLSHEPRGKPVAVLSYMYLYLLRESVVSLHSHALMPAALVGIADGIKEELGLGWNLGVVRANGVT